jgi:UbiD family decarboxylase
VKATVFMNIVSGKPTAKNAVVAVFVNTVSKRAAAKNVKKVRNGTCTANKCVLYLQTFDLEKKSLDFFVNL